MEIEERWESISDREFLQFKSIPESERRHPRRDLCAFIYLHEKLGGDGDIVAGAEHDEIFLDYDIEQAGKLTDEDIIYLSRCGVRLGEYGLCMSA